MAESFNEGLKKTLSCPMCNHVFVEPVIASCCGTTFCINCIGNGTKCPLHKKYTHYTPNRILQEMVNQLPFTCVCGESVPRALGDEHSKICKKVIMSCKRCKFKGNQDERVQHFLEAHSNVIFERFTEII